MSRQTGPLYGAMAPELTSNNVNPYGEGAPFGDLFQVAPAPVGGPVYCDAHLLGHGPPLLMMQTLLSDTAELKERISAVEGALLERLQPSIPAHAAGICCQRSGRVTRSKRGALGTTRPPASHGATPSLDDSDSDTSQPTTTDASTDTDHDFGSVDDDGISHPLKCALQSYVTKIFRRVCHVSGRHWPDPDVICASPVTLEVYPTPVFSVHVMDLRNRDLVDVVAR
ncbi:hypothetical protein B0H14DRAFT_2590222 [Mycena olivaceomarginata]|nr:hypothetical protein B0H14DRAFT_2590222 [Mycena olivaceomarginata]